MRVWTRTGPIQDDAGVKESIAIEHNLTSGGFEQWATELATPRMDTGSLAIVNNSLGCNCLNTSSVGQQMAAQCWSGKPTDTPHSPVRDWWTGS